MGSGDATSAAARLPVRVAVRCRRSTPADGEPCIAMPSNTTVTVTSGEEEATFTFDACFAESAAQHEVYTELVASPMAALFDDLEGGYPALILQRRIGLPAVAMTSAFRQPFRYGDIAEVRVVVRRLGRRSAELGYEFVREADGALCATMTHTVVSSDLVAVRSCDMPFDVREALERHLERGTEGVERTTD